MLNRKAIGLCFVLATLFAFAVIFSSEALAAYTRIADNTVPAYTDRELRNRQGNERVDRGDEVIVFEETDNAYFVRYPTPRGTKDRWVPKNIFNGGGLKGDVNNDGRVDQSDADLLLAHLRGQTDAINRENADMNGDGDVSIADVQAILSRVRSNSASIPSNLQSLIDQWNNRTWVDHTYLSGVKQCKEFAAFIFDRMYGVGYIGGGSMSDNPRNYFINLSNPNRVSLRDYRTDLSASSARDLFAQAQSGDFVQIRRRHGGPHSGIFVNRTDNGIVLFEANADGRNSIRTNTYTYEQLAEKNYAMSLYCAR